MPRKRKPFATQKGNLTVAQQEDKKTGRTTCADRQGNPSKTANLAD